MEGFCQELFPSNHLHLCALTHFQLIDTFLLSSGLQSQKYGASRSWLLALIPKQPLVQNLQDQRSSFSPASSPTISPIQALLAHLSI